MQGLIDKHQTVCSALYFDKHNYIFRLDLVLTTGMNYFADNYKLKTLLFMSQFPLKFDKILTLKREGLTFHSAYVKNLSNRDDVTAHINAEWPSHSRYERIP